MQADEEVSDAETEPYSTPENQDTGNSTPNVPKGKFNITTKGLKKARRYSCLFCEKICDSAKLLT